MEVSSHALALARVYGIRFPHRGVHQSDARSSGFSPHHGRIRRRQASALRPGRRSRAALGDSERRRSGQRRYASGERRERSAYGISTDADLRAENIRSGFDGLHFDVRLPGAAAGLRVSAGGAHQRVEHSGGGRRRTQLRHGSGDDRRRNSRRVRRFPDASNASMADSRFWWWSITPIPTTRCAT